MVDLLNNFSIQKKSKTGKRARRVKVPRRALEVLLRLTVQRVLSGQDCHSAVRESSQKVISVSASPLALPK